MIFLSTLHSGRSAEVPASFQLARLDTGLCLTDYPGMPHFLSGHVHTGLMWLGAQRT